MQSSVHYFGIRLDYLELLCYIGFQQLNPKTNGTSSEFRLCYLHSSFRLLIWF